MFPAEFDYVAPETLDDALRHLADNPEARVLAGGQSLIPTLKLRLGAPPLLVDLGKLDELRYIRRDGDTIEIGALTRHRDVAASDLLSGGARCLAEAAAAVGDVQVRNLGTIGGNLAHADPAADLTAPALALDATLLAQGPSGERSLAVGEFFLGPWMTALEPGEILTGIRFSVTDGSGGAYEQLEQAASGFALAGAAAVLELDGNTCRSAKVALTGVASHPARLPELEDRLVGNEIDEDFLREACAGVGESIESAQEDIHASAEYRRAMAEVYARRAILRAAA